MDFELPCAIVAGDLSVVKNLIKNNSEVLEQSKIAVLSTASCNGHLDIVTYVVSIGANVNEFDDVVIYLLTKGSYHETITFNFYMINNLYCSGHFELLYKLLCNNKSNIPDDNMKQFNDITKSVNKIIEERKLKTLLAPHFIDVIVEVNSSQ